MCIPNILCTGWTVKHGRMFLVPCKTWLVQCTLLLQSIFYEVPEQQGQVFLGRVVPYCIGLSQSSILVFSTSPPSYIKMSNRAMWGSWTVIIQGDQLIIVVFFWDLGKSDLSRNGVHWTSHFIQGTRKTRTCLIGHLFIFTEK